MNAVRVPASSANLGAGFDVFGMALDLTADLGTGPAPADTTALDEHHPATIAFRKLGGAGPVWMRSPIPMGRGLGFSGAVRVGGAALAAVAASGRDALVANGERILAVCAALEGHSDNVAASLHGGIVAAVGDRVVPLRVGPVLAAAAVVVWVPEATTSTDRSRGALPVSYERADVVHNLGRAVQFAAAVEHDDPQLLRGATDDLLHQSPRLALIPGGAEALESGVRSGAWCGWLSGSGPTIAFLCDASAVDAVRSALPADGHSKVLHIDRLGTRVISGEP